MPQVIIRRETTVNSYADTHIDAAPEDLRRLLRRLLQDADTTRGQGFWADADTTVFAGNEAHRVPRGADLDAIVQQIVP